MCRVPIPDAKLKSICAVLGRSTIPDTTSPDQMRVLLEEIMTFMTKPTTEHAQLMAMVGAIMGDASQAPVIIAQLKGLLLQLA